MSKKYNLVIQKDIDCSELENTTLDSISNNIRGMYLEFDNKYMKYDSTLFLTFGYRYVDPNFRSGGAQTRRIENVSTKIKQFINILKHGFN